MVVARVGEGRWITALSMVRRGPGSPAVQEFLF